MRSISLCIDRVWRNSGRRRTEKDLKQSPIELRIIKTNVYTDRNYENVPEINGKSFDFV